MAQSDMTAADRDAMKDMLRALKRFLVAKKSEEDIFLEELFEAINRLKME